MANLKDYATSTVASPPSPAASGVTFTVQNGHGARFPAVPFNVTAHPADQMPTLDNAEKLLVTAVSGDEFTVTRAQGDTDAQDIVAGWRISNSVFGDDIILRTEILDEDDMASDAEDEVPSQQSVKAYVDTIIQDTKEALYPVGSIYTNATDSTNPGTLLGFGTWTAFGAGRVMVGLNSGDADFDTVEETGGAKTVTPPSHTHPLSDAGQAKVALGVTAAPNIFERRVTTTQWTATHQGDATTVGGSTTNQSVGAGLTGLTDADTPSALSVVQPYIVVYMWKRTA